MKVLKDVNAREGRERLNYYYSMIIRGTTMQNREALKLMQAEIKECKELHEDLRHNPFYEEWTAEGRQEGRTKDAILLMRKMDKTAKEAAELLEFTADEFSALLTHIQSKNGNG